MLDCLRDESQREVDRGDKTYEEDVGRHVGNTDLLNGT
jgi:hypothetical protein